MGELGVYILMITVFMILIGTIVLTYRWIRKIIRLFKSRRYIRALYTFLMPVVVIGFIIYYIVPIVNTIIMLIGIIASVGLMLSIKDDPVYYYPEN